MKQLFQKVKTQYLSKQFLLFLCVGAINTLNGTVLSLLFSTFLHANFAFVAGYITSLIISYFLNSRITFSAQLSFIGLIKYCIAYIPNFIIQNIVVFVLFNLLEFPKIIAYAAAAVIGIPVTYALMKCFAYRNKKNL